jgi:hypothetical protein
MADEIHLPDGTIIDINLDHHQPELEKIVSSIIPEPPPSRRWHPTWDDDYNADCASNDSLVSDLEVRIIALEEAVASRRARRRLARSIRRADKAYRWAGSFFAARLEATTHEWLNGPQWLAEARKGAHR